MELTLFIRSRLARAAGSIGLPERRIRKLSENGYPILMYHRIVPWEQAFPTIQEGMYVTPETFRMHVGYLKDHFQLVPLSDPSVGPGNRVARGSGLPACALTFDDGWRDFYQFAYPVLKEQQVPTTVFLPTRFIGTGDRFWTDRLAWLLSRTSGPANPEAGTDVTGHPLARMIAGFRGEFTERLERAVGLLKSRAEDEVEEVLAGLSRGRGAGEAPAERAFLNWDEVREMRESGLVSFGSHTHNHRILIHLREEEIRDELTLSMEALFRERAVDPSFVPFCYPNGSLNARIAVQVREAGYRTAVTTRDGWNGRENPRFELRRVAVHQDMTKSREMFGCRIAGLL